jgi:DNA-binding transcriptional LysR family regulator
MTAGSATKAAAQLHCTQPAISRALASLEREIGFKLFIRHHGRLTPTAQGLAFYRESERALLGVDGLLTIAKKIRTNGGLHLRIAAVPQLAGDLVPAALQVLLEDFPELRISLEEREPGLVERSVSELEFDCGLSILPVKLAGLVSAPFIEVRPMAAMAARHRLAAKSALSIQDLGDEPLIVLNSGDVPRRELETLLATKKVRAKIALETSSDFVICQLVARGLGIAVVDPFSAGVLPTDRIALRPMNGLAPVRFGFVHPANRDRSLLVSRLIDILRAMASTHLKGIIMSSAAVPSERGRRHSRLTRR